MFYQRTPLPNQTEFRRVAVEIHQEELDSTDSEDSMELDEEDNRSASNDHSMTTRGRSRRSHMQVPVETRARANRPPPQVPSDQSPPQVPSDQPPPQEPSDQPPQHAHSFQPPQQVPSDQPPQHTHSFQPPPQVPSDQPPQHTHSFQPPPQVPSDQPPQHTHSFQPPQQVPSDLQTDNSLSRSALVSDNYDTYLSIMGAMPDLSSDEEVNEAILASLESHPTSTNDTSAKEPEMEEIADLDLYAKVKKVSECTSLDELQQATEPLTDYLANAGCLRPLKGIEDKDLLVENILMFQVVHRHIPGNAGVLHAMITAYSQGKAKILYTLPKKFQYT
ncbi:unnamed protein product [Arctogadus glacialis]